MELYSKGAGSGSLGVRLRSANVRMPSAFPCAARFHRLAGKVPAWGKMCEISHSQADFSFSLNLFGRDFLLEVKKKKTFKKMLMTDDFFFFFF